MGLAKQRPTALDLLSLLTSGEVIVTIGGYPLLSIRSDERALDLEVNGAKEVGLDLSKIVKLEGGTNIFSGSELIARRLSSLGWKLTLYDKGSRLLTMGRGVSRLTGRITTSPLRLKRLLGTLR